MTLPDTYSRRKRRAAGSSNDVYQYDKMSEKLRVQTVLILHAAMGDYSDSTYNFEAKEAYEFIVDTARRDKGAFTLVPHPKNLRDELHRWILSESDTESLLDVIELCFRVIDSSYREYTDTSEFTTQTPDSAIAEFNARCLEDGFGIQYVDGQIVEISSTVLHSEVVLPAFHLTHVAQFSTVNQEYHAAHKAFRNGEYETCITECGKSFESTLKIIAKSRGWAYKETDPASKLLEAAYKADFIPQYMQTEFSALRSVLESGVPTVRNKSAAHGAGNSPRAVPKHLAAFQLHQTGAAIVFLVENHLAINSP